MRTRSRLLLLVLMPLSAAAPRAALAGEVSGGFRLARQAFAVGEPIVVEFTATNGAASDVSFFEGGDYRGTLRHDLYRFRVVNAAGRDFTQDLWGNEGGEGTTITLKPGEAFRSWQLLGGWVHLLPPGAYRVHCARTLSRDPHAVTREEVEVHAPVTVEQDLAFEVTPYEKARIVAALADMKVEEAAARKGGAKRFHGMPVEWALADLNEKFEVGAAYAGKEAELEQAVFAALPERWDDRYYLEYGLKANRTWLTRERPEEFRLTFSVRNNGSAAFAHGLAESSLLVNGTLPEAWPGILRMMLEEKAIGATVEPGVALELGGRFNAVLPAGKPARIVWSVRGVTRTADVRLGP